MINLIKDLSNAYGAPGFEEEVIDKVACYKEDLTMEVDKLMNVYLAARKRDNSKKTIMLDAHLDEVGFMVQFIDEKGLLKFINLGGWVTENIPAQLVMVKNSEGNYIKGIVSSKPPHFMTDEERENKLKLEDLSIDLGATSREEVIEDFKIEVGAPVVPFVDFDYNEKNGIMMGKAFDNRLGCAAAIETLKNLRSNKEFNIVAALASQEEVGTRGAYLTSRRVKPDLAIVFEGSPADDTFTQDHYMQAGLGRGPQIRHRDSSYIANHRFISFAKKIANEAGIDIQDAVRTAGGTNAGRIHLSNDGVPTLVLGIPVRYVHTHHGYASIYDFQDTVKLATRIINHLDEDIIKKI